MFDAIESVVNGLDVDSRQLVRHRQPTIADLNGLFSGPHDPVWCSIHNVPYEVGLPKFLEGKVACGARLRFSVMCSLDGLTCDLVVGHSGDHASGMTSWAQLAGIVKEVRAKTGEYPPIVGQPFANRKAVYVSEPNRFEEFPPYPVSGDPVVFRNSGQEMFRRNPHDNDRFAIYTPPNHSKSIENCSDTKAGDREKPN